MAPQLPHPIRLASQPEAQPTKIGIKSPEDVVVVAAVRTAMTKGCKGGLKNTRADGKSLSFSSLFNKCTYFYIRTVVFCLQGHCGTHWH